MGSAELKANTHMKKKKILWCWAVVFAYLPVFSVWCSLWLWSQFAWTVLIVTKMSVSLIPLANKRMTLMKNDDSVCCRIGYIVEVNRQQPQKKWFASTQRLYGKRTRMFSARAFFLCALYELRIWSHWLRLLTSLVGFPLKMHSQHLHHKCAHCKQYLAQ